MATSKLTYNSGTWTDARYRSFITSTLRAGSRRWPPKYSTLAEAKTEKKENKATGRIAQHYRCVGCASDHPAKDVQVDHINPIVDPIQGFQSWDVFIANLFCEKDNLQVLCKTCHTKKTNQEKETKKKHANK